MNKLFYCFIIVILFLQTLANNTIDPDYWARLLQGNYFLRTGNVMKQDVFSYTPTHLWLDHEWGSSVVFSFIQTNFGLLGILTTKILLLFLIFFIIFKTIRLQTNKNNNFLNIILFSLSVYALPTLTQSGFRCHFFTFLFFTLFIYILELVRKQDKKLLLLILPPIFLIWCNMHGGCVSGLGLLILYSIGEALNGKKYKHYIYTFVLMFLVMFINPYGIDYVKFIFTASTMQRPYITEWISPFMHPLWNFMLWFKILFIFYCFIIIKNYRTIKQDYTKILILIVCLYLSCKNIKSTPFFIITSFIFLYEYIILLMPKKTFKIINITTCIIFIAVSVFSITSFFFLSEQPCETVEFIKVNKLDGKILAPLDMGSYIAYKLYPDNLIYMDGRYEELYFDKTKNLLDNFYNTKDNWYEILETKPDFIIIPIDASVNDLMNERKDYKLIWTDEQNWLFSSTDKLKPIYKKPSNNQQYYIKRAFETKF